MCNIQFSSGTTGKPKAAGLSHYSMVNNPYYCGLRQELDKNYRRICINNPFFHAYGTSIGIMNSMLHGSTLVLPAPHFSPEDSLKTIAKEKCDVIYGTPTSRGSFNHD
jgi:medium-chain acyl-CoA ligase, mitochondrial